MDYPQIAKDIIAQQGMFTATLVLSPPIANFIKQRFDTIEEFEKWAAPAPSAPMVAPEPKSDSKEAAPAPRMPAFSFPTSNVIVTGASNNNYWSAGGLSYSRSIKIDDWR